MLGLPKRVLYAGKRFKSRCVATRLCCNYILFFIFVAVSMFILMGIVWMNGSIFNIDYVGNFLEINIMNIAILVSIFNLSHFPS